MLQKLIIKNVALIDCATIDFINGLNVLSGETGSVESLNFVLGAKADKSLIRSGTAECSVQAVFDVSNIKTIKDTFKELEIEEDDTLIVFRKYTLDGKNTIKINGMPATVGMLKKFTCHLVDVHGQSEHFSLLKNSNQLALIDKCGGEELALLKNEVSNTYYKYKYRSSYHFKRYTFFKYSYFVFTRYKVYYI